MGKGRGTIDPIYLYLFVLLVALPLGFLAREQLAFLAGFNSYFLAAIFFLGALKIHPKEIAALHKQKYILAIFNFGMLIALPFLVFLIAENIVPGAALPLLILAAMPTGMAAPLLTEIVGGRQSLALAITVTSSLLAPFTVPLMLKLLAGADVEVSLTNMFYSIATIIVVPFALAWILQRLIPRQLKRTERYFSPLSIIILGLLLTGVVAQQSSSAILNMRFETLAWYLLIVSIFMALFYAAGYVLGRGKNRRDRVTLTISFANMNFTLAIYLAHRYFNSPEVVLPITLAVVPWFVFIIIIKLIVSAGWIK